MPVTKVKSRWDSGNLIFHESDSLAVIANILTIGTTGVTVGSATNDINFSWLGTTTGTFDSDAGAHTLVTTGLDWTITGDIALTGNLTVDIGDVQIGDDDYLMFGDGTGGDVSARWVSGTSILEWLPLTDAVGAFVIGNSTKNIDFKVWGASGAGYYLLYDESEDDLILAGVNSQLELESTVNSTTTGSGSIHTLGGLGVALNSFFGGTLSVGTISAINAAGPSVVNVAATNTVPTLCPDRADLTTGIGWQTAAVHIIISGGDEYSFTATNLVMNGNGITGLGTIGLTGAITISPTAPGTFLDFVLETEWTGGTLINADFANATTLGSDAIGFLMDLDTQTTMTTDFDVTGFRLLLPNLTQTAANTTLIYGFDLPTAGALVNTNGTITWRGINLQLPAITETSGTVVATGLYITGATITTNGTLNGILMTGNMTTGIDLSGGTLVNDIVLQNGATITNGGAGTLTITEPLIEFVGAVTGDTTLAVTSTNATAAAVNAIYGYNDAGATWTSGNQVGVRGKTNISGGFDIVSATGVWAGVEIEDAIGAGSGLICGLNVEVSSDNVSVPNAIAYIQSLPESGADFSDVPYLVFSETRGGATGTGSRYLFEVGHAQAATIPTIGTGELFYENTLQIAVNQTAGNRTSWYIPLSSAEASYTTAFPIVSSLATGAAIDITAPATGIDIGTCSAYAINFTGNEGRILMGTDTNTRASFAATGDVVRFYTVNMATSGICTGLDFEHSLGYQGNTTMQATAVRGVLRILTGTTVNGTSKIYEGASGYFLNEGTVNSASIDCTGVRGVVMDGGVWTSARNVSCGWFDWQLNNALSGITNTSILRLTNNANQGAENPDNVMYLFTPYMEYLLNFQEGSATGGEIIAAGGSGGATRSYKIKCRYHQTDFYLTGYTD